jgi:hypothetical protein
MTERLCGGMMIGSLSPCGSPHKIAMQATLDHLPTLLLNPSSRWIFQSHHGRSFRQTVS